MQKDRMKSKIYFKWIKDFSVKVKMIKQIEKKKVREYLGAQKAKYTYTQTYIYVHVYISIYVNVHRKLGIIKF